ncbi:MAG: hypothetical protein GY898_01655 [Proteobacteria bacterium]|nr:hypothetical protein [Pseudomonadota bacterium]
MRLPSLLCLAALTACTPEPDPVLYDTLPSALALAETAEDRWVGADLAFDWQQTVLAYGFHRLYSATGDERWQGFYRDWLDAGMAERWDDPEDPPSFVSSDSLSPSILAAAAMAEDSAADYAAIAASADAYLATVPRSDAGAVVHWGPDHPLLGGNPQVWVDTLFMVGVYLLQRYAETGDDAFLDAWAVQYLAFVEHCRDPADHLYRHAWDLDDEVNIPPEDTYWARGNAWVLVSAGEAVRLAGADHPSLTEPLARAAEHAAAIAAVQDEGMWRTVLNSPQGDDYRNYRETSATALIAFALLQLGGDEAAIAAAVDAVEAQIVTSETGAAQLIGTSLPTNPGDYEYYVSVDQFPDQMTGIGAALMLLSDVHGRERPQ